VDIKIRDHRGASLVTLRGTLDVSTYAGLRDALLKAAAEEPLALIVDVDRMVVRSAPSLSVFSLVWMRVSEWPGVPVLLLAGDFATYAQMVAQPMARFVPVHGDLGSAMSALVRPPLRRRDHVWLSGVPASSAAGRAFVRSTCQRWGLASMCEDAETVATELVENALRHTTGGADLRLELRRGLLSVAVADGSSRQAVLREAVHDGMASTGLSIVANVARAWGCAPTVRGKVVWATLRLR
jgi:hypothetical protein